jgi:two-component system sensor histidine kinase VanS
LKKQSITSKILFLFIIFTIIIIGIFWVLQDQFLNRFYIYNKVKQVKGYGIRIHEQIRDGNMDEEIGDYIEAVVEEIDGRMLIIDSNDNIIYQAGRVHMNRAGKIPGIYLKQAREGKVQYYHVLDQQSGHGHGLGQSKHMDLLTVLVPLENQIYFFQTPLQPIEEAVAISQKFTLYLLFIAFFVALILSWFFSRTITNPLLHLNEVARQMGELNFDVKCEEDRGDEIGDLGRTLNFLTEKLKNTIEALREELLKERKIDKMRKQFIARVSHELQTPISLIRGYTEALQDGMATNKDEEEEYFGIIEGETIKMSNLIRDLLDLGQLESGSFKINMESFNIITMIDQSLSKFELLKKEKNLRFQMVRETDWEDVIGDEYRIEQVITNLLQNAVNHCDVGGLIDITVQEENDRIKINIYNDGKQIGEEEKEAIWQSFYKTEEGKKGTGLGLAIVRSVLQLHESEYGIMNQESGVTFFFTLNKSFS